MPDNFEALADILANQPEKEKRMRGISIRIPPDLDFSLRFMAERLHVPYTRLATMLLQTAAEQFGPICKARVEAVPGNLMMDPSPSKVRERLGDDFFLDENDKLGTRTKEEHEADLQAMVDRYEEEHAK